MLQELTNFVHELFPSISPYTRDEVNKAIRQFEKKNELYNFLRTQSLPYLAQGDIVGALPFYTYEPDGSEQSYTTMGILLSNTCDTENDETIVFSPMLPLHIFGEQGQQFTRNLKYNLLYFPDSKLSEYIVDFSVMNTFPKTALLSRLDDGRLKKVASLNNLGYYLFLTKLTVHLLRPEDTNVQNDRVI